MLYKSKAILHQGLKIWNSLPVSVTCSSNLFSFTMKLQEFLPHICSTYSLFNYCVVSQVALPISPVATWVSSLSINYNAVKKCCIVKKENK